MILWNKERLFLGDHGMIYLYIQAVFLIFYYISGSILSMANHRDEKLESQL